MAMAAREKNVFKAKLAEEAERFDEMVEFMNKVVSSVHGADELTPEERNLLSVAYKNVIAPRRNALRILLSYEEKEHSRGNEPRADAIRDYRLKVEDELSNICYGLLELIDSQILVDPATAPAPTPDLDPALTPAPASASVLAPSTDSKVFFLKMKGDYNRYLAEFKIGNEKKIAADNTLSAYKAAQEIARAELAPTHPIRLGLALNFAVFYYEILSSPERACTLAKEAFDEAIPELESVGEESYKASTMIMQLLRDNLNLWTSDLKDDGTDDIGEAPKAVNKQ